MAAVDSKAANARSSSVIAARMTTLISVAPLAGR
jgi:hypothetical protein